MFSVVYFDRKNVHMSPLLYSLWYEMCTIVISIYELYWQQQVLPVKIGQSETKTEKLQTILNDRLQLSSNTQSQIVLSPKKIYLLDFKTRGNLQIRITYPWFCEQQNKMATRILTALFWRSLLQN